MIHAQNIPVKVLYSPQQTIATNNDAVVFVDRLAYGPAHYAQVCVVGPALVGTNASVLTALRLVEADVSTSTASSSWSNITEFVGTTSTTLGTNAFTISGPTATGVVGHAHLFNVDLRKRKRYLGVLATAANATSTGIYCDVRFFRVDQSPESQANVTVNG
jgi:hypothetical protein